MLKRVTADLRSAHKAHVKAKEHTQKKRKVTEAAADSKAKDELIGGLLSCSPVWVQVLAWWNSKLRQAGAVWMA